MRQLFFISSQGSEQVEKAFNPKILGATCHVWADKDSDVCTGEIVGVVQMNGQCDAEQVIDRLEAFGISWLPNHRDNEVIKPEHAHALAKHGVKPNHTTAQAMTLVHNKAGFPPLKPKRF